MTKSSRPRIALVYLLDLRSHRQIMERAAAQVSIFRACGLDATAICMDRGLSGDLPDGFIGIRTRGPGVLRAFLEARLLRKLLAEMQPDGLIVRYGYASGTLLGFARAFRLILEIHSDDTRELPARRVVRTYARLSNALFRDKLMRATSGGMFVTSALVDLPAFAQLNGPRAVIPNGISVPTQPLPVPQNARPLIGYSVGYSAPWQGLDRLAQLADQLPEFDFRLVIPDGAIAAVLRSARVQVVVAKTPNEYRAILAEFDVALGGLALERKGITVASALKVRESVALGIPTLLFSRDEDLDGVDSPTICTVARGAWDAADVISKMRSFVNTAHGTRIPDELRQRVNINAKAELYARLVFKVLESGNTVYHARTSVGDIRSSANHSTSAPLT